LLILPKAGNAVYFNLDRAGVAASCACAAHCALTPFFLGLLPLAGVAWLAGEGAEWAFVAATITIGLLSLLPAYARRHGRVRPLLLFSAGAALLLCARLLLEDDVRLEVASAVAGALLIASAHVTNLRLCRPRPV
jgi:hypothetical protein